MPAESLTQVVDENDHPIGVEVRRTIQAEGLWHRVVGVWLIDESGYMLVQRRQAGRGLDDEKLDSSAAGHIDPGEDYRVSVVREAKEELSVTLDPDELEEVAYIRTEAHTSDKILRRFTKVFIARVARQAIEAEMQLNEEEVGGVEWVSAEEVRRLVVEHPEKTVPAFVIAWYVLNKMPIPEEIARDNSLVVIGAEA